MESSAFFKEAEKLLKKDRNETYGDPIGNYYRIAQIWSALLGFYISPDNAAMMMAVLKIYRATTNPEHKDSFVDAVAYIAIANQASSSSSSSSSP